MKPEQNKSYKRLGEKEHLMQYQPSKEPTGGEKYNGLIMVHSQQRNGSTCNVQPPGSVKIVRGEGE